MSLEEHRVRIQASLTAWAMAISSELPNVERHIQDAPSHVYAVSQLLVFLDKRAVEDELVVVEVAVRSGPAPRWSIDATGQFGTFIAEDSIADPDQDALTADADVAVARVEAFLTRSRSAVTDVLRVAS